MQIKDKTIYKQSFKAYHIANASNPMTNATKLRLFQLTENDRPYINTLRKSIDLTQLMPKMNKDNIDIWETILDIGLNQSIQKNKTGILLTQNNIPCGIMAFSQKINSHKLDTICTWPAVPGQRVPFAGKTLFQLLFDDFLKSNSKKIELDAVTNSPFSPVAKYMQLGFKQTGGENGILAMRILREEVIKSVQKLNNLIKLKLITTPTEEINLFNLQK